MVYVLALLIFTGLNAACWFVSVASCRGAVDGPDPAARHYSTVAALAVGAAAVFSFAPRPANDVISLRA